jgi:hypothetical protein
MAPVCNEVFRNGTSDPSDKDKECACPTGTTYCALDNTCKKPGEVCGAKRINKQIIGIVGNEISYRITGSYSGFSLPQEFTDAVS